MATSEEIKDKQAINAFADRVIQKIVTKQRYVTTNCFHKSHGDIDKFYECFSDFHKNNLTNLPKVETGIEWAGLQYSKCLEKTKTNPKTSREDCVREYKNHVEYFATLLE